MSPLVIVAVEFRLFFYTANAWAVPFVHLGQEVSQNWLPLKMVIVMILLPCFIVGVVTLVTTKKWLPMCFDKPILSLRTTNVDATNSAVLFKSNVR